MKIPKGWERVTQGKSKRGDMTFFDNQEWVKLHFSIGEPAKSYTRGLIRRIKKQPKKDTV